MTAILGIDVGGTVVKATLFDLAEGGASSRGRVVPVRHPAPGHNERDPHRIWEAVAEVVHELLSAGPHPRIAAVGVTGHGNGLYLVDRYGRPTRPAVMASDTRASGIVRDAMREGAGQALAPLTWNRLWPGQPGPVLAWFDRNEPGALAEAAHALMCKDFIRLQLVGEVGTELTDQSCNGLYDNAHGRWCDEAFEALDISARRGLLPDPRPSTEVAGEVSRAAAEVTGIPRGTPVVGGAVDNVALHLGSGVLDGSRLCIAAGTWSVNQLMVDPAEMVPEIRLGADAPLAACRTAAPRQALLIDASATSASALAWAVNQVMHAVRDEARTSGSDVFELVLRRVALREPADTDPVFVPYLDGSRDEPGARGAWLDLASWHDADHLMSAVVEGICMEHRRHIDRIAGDAAELPLRLSGGAAKSATWAQRFADVCQRPVEVSPVEELGALGAAVIAGAGVGVFDSLATGAQVLNSRQSTFTPDEARSRHFAGRYARYRQLADVVAASARP